MTGSTTITAVHFEERLARVSTRRLVPLSPSIYSHVVAESADEAAWLNALNADVSVRHVLRWPRWHRVTSPLGLLDPGWVVLRGTTVTCHPPRAVQQDLALRGCLLSLCRALDLALCIGD